jgi:hypothetical protein
MYYQFRENSLCMSLMETTLLKENYNYVYGKIESGIYKLTHWTSSVSSDFSDRLTTFYKKKIKNITLMI